MYAAWREKRPLFRDLPPDAEFVVQRPAGLLIGDRLFAQGEKVPQDQFERYQLRNQYEARNIQLAPEGGSPATSPESPESPGEAPATSPGLFSTTFGQLREQCRSLGLPTWGNKKQLRDRLKE